MISSSTLRQRGFMAVMLTAGLVAIAAPPVPAGAEASAGPPGLSYTARGCIEPAALVTVPRVTLEPKLPLPHPFRLRDFAPGVAALVVGVASCESISVGGKESGPSHFSDVGVMIESPDGSAGEHLYQLLHFSDDEDLLRLMSTVGMATEKATISLDKTLVSATGTVSSKSSRYELSVIAPPPESGSGSGGNTWWHDGSHGIVRVRNEGTSFAANLGAYVLELAEDSPLARILGTTVLTGVAATAYHGEHRGQLSMAQL